MKFPLFHLLDGIKVMSLPVRGAWVEMSLARVVKLITAVAPRAGSVG